MEEENQEQEFYLFFYVLMGFDEQMEQSTSCWTLQKADKQDMKDHTTVSAPGQ